MSAAIDFAIVDLPAMLAREVRDFNADGTERPYDGSWHRAVAQVEFTLAEFLSAKGLVDPGVVIERRDDLVIRFSQLTKLGQAFVMSQATERWRGSLDRRKPGAPINADGLERRWKKFREETAER